MEISGNFKIDDFEKIKLDGKYEIQSNVINEEVDKINNIWEKENINCQSVYVIGNILVRTNTEGVQDLIKLFMRYTHDPCKDVDLDLSVKKQKVMMGGTICPTRKVLFIYKNKMFIAFGRYIFGYDHNCVVINREGTKCSYKKQDNRNVLIYKVAQDHKMSSDEIALCVADYKGHKLANDYTYAFLIYDKDTEVVDAFGLYR